ncbi:MAG: hypothetical protein ACREM6_05360 [Vulcanimicrobiaceae bacterium]
MHVYLRITLFVAIALVGFVVVGFILKLAFAAAIIAAIGFAALFAVNFVRVAVARLRQNRVSSR